MAGRLAILWHLHQPDYRAPDTGRPMMPWARLHGLRGYRDLLVDAVEHGLPWTINVVPLLVDQLFAYAAGGDDRHLELTRREAASLDPRESAEASDTLPGGHPAMTRAWPAWDALRSRVSAGERLDAAGLRDLQVWSTLSWFGATAFRDFPLLRELAHKGRGFSEDDKAAMLAVHDTILRDLPDRLRAVATAEGPCLSTTPYFHPILPLLVDVRHAGRNLPHVGEDLAFAFPEDARWQLHAARDRIEEVAGVRPIGLWPSEGSVSPEVVELAAEAGFRWMATDDRVLARSDHTISEFPGGWDLGHGVRGFFRDQGLSDRIGFRYAAWAAADAARDLAASARERAGVGILVLALDGENPWETFFDAGGAFREALRAAVPEAGLRWITLDAASAEPAVGTVRHLHTGSWVNADFRIWFGHAEDRAAWRALAEVREAAEHATPEAKEKAMPHLRAAEGSDWTWWYGDDFRTPWASTFDRIYRDHLKAAWRALGLAPPDSLDRPIAAPHPPERTPPQRWLDLDWDDTGTWVGWAGSGVLRSWGSSLTMARASDVSSVRFGWSRATPEDRRPDALWLLVQVRSGTWDVERPTGAEARPHPEGFVVRVAGGGPVELQLRAVDGTAWPEEPVLLSAPEPPTLAWWDV